MWQRVRPNAFVTSQQLIQLAEQYLKNSSFFGCFFIFLVFKTTTTKVTTSTTKITTKTLPTTVTTAMTTMMMGISTAASSSPTTAANTPMSPTTERATNTLQESSSSSTSSDDMTTSDLPIVNSRQSVAAISNASNSNIGVIIGAAVGGVLCCAIVIAVIIVVVHRVSIYRCVCSKQFIIVECLAKCIETESIVEHRSVSTIERSISATVVINSSTIWLCCSKFCRRWCCK